MCAACRTPVRSYQYRYHPPESSSFERCIGFSWCSGCRIFRGSMVFVARKRVLVDALASLPDDQRRRLEASEPALIEFLDRRARREAAPRRRPGPKPG
ncbi:hypothetical protein [Streptomyces sp. NPDC004285]